MIMKTKIKQLFESLIDSTGVASIKGQVKL
jgi:hypothetical protein